MVSGALSDRDASHGLTRCKQDIVIPESYPFQPVKMKFITKVYHPNVSSASGAICLDILKDAWSPVLTLKSTLISLQSLLCSPEPNDPQDAEVAKHYMTSKASFDDTARYWTKLYAGGPGAAGGHGATKQDEVAMAGLEAAHVNRFEALGFSKDKVVSTFLIWVKESMFRSERRCPDRRSPTLELSRNKHSQDSRRTDCGETPIDAVAQSSATYPILNDVVVANNLRTGLHI